MHKQNNDEIHNDDLRSFLYRSLITGFFGGILLGFSWIVSNYFNFAELTPRSILLFKWKTVKWLNGWLGDVITILIISLISVSISIIYYMLFKKIYSIWLGIAFGIGVWIIVFFIIGLTFPHYKITKLEKETIISTLSLFILYGTFIGYSISYDYYRIKNDSIIGSDS